jgi:hypothetical protein
VFQIPIVPSALKAGILTVTILNAYLVQSLFQTALHAIQQTSVFLVKAAIRFKKEFASPVETRIQLINTMSKTISVLFAA